MLSTMNKIKKGLAAIIVACGMTAADTADAFAADSPKQRAGASRSAPLSKGRAGGGRSMSPGPSRSFSPRSSGPSYSRSAPSFSRPAPARSAPSVSRGMPSVTRPSPSVSRPAPSVSRPARTIDRSSGSVTRSSPSIKDRAIETPRGFTRVTPQSPVTVQPRPPQRVAPARTDAYAPRKAQGSTSPTLTPRVDKSPRLADRDGNVIRSQGVRPGETINRTPLNRVPDRQSGLVTPRKGFAGDANGVRGGGFGDDINRSSRDSLYQRWGRDRDWDGHRAHRWDDDHHDGHHGHHGHHRHHGHHGHYGYGSWYGYGRHCYSPYRYGYRSCYPGYGYGYGYYYPYGIYASLYLGGGYGYYDGFYGYNRTYDIYDYEPYPATTYTTYNTTVYESVPAQTQTYTESYVTPSTTQTYQSAPSSYVTPAPVQAPTETYVAPAQPADATLAPPPSTQTAPAGDQAQYKEPADVRTGHQHFAKGEYADAQAAFLRAVLADDKDPYARLFYSMSAVATADYPTAAASIRSALELAPDLITEPIDLRQFYKDEETLKSHLAGLTFWVESRSDGAEARLLLAYLMFATGDANGADAELARIPAGTSFATQVDQLRSSVSRVKQAITKQQSATQSAPANP